MTDYTKTTDFTSKDSLPSGDSGKIIRGAEFGTEFDNIETAVNSKSNIDNPSFTGNITVTGTVDGRDIAADGTKLDTIETSADVTDTANVTAAGAVMDSELTDITAVKALNQGVATTDSPTFAAVTSTGNVTVGGTVDGRDVAADGTKLDGIEAGATADQTAAQIKTAYESNADTNAFTDADHTKLDGIEASADVTDATNVTAAGALMDSEVTNLAQVKAFDSSDYATAAQGTTADNALPKTGGAMTGAITTNSTFDGRDVATDGTKLDGIEALADVTDTANVTAAGALMDSELTSEASVKALNQGVATTDSPTFAGATVNGTVEFDGLSGTGAVTVTDILDQDDMSGNSATALATQQSIKSYVDSQVATSDTLAEVLANGNATGGTDVAFGDNDKAIFGAGSDLQIYHTTTGNHSIIAESGSGNLVLAADNLEINNAANNANKITATTGGAVTLFHNNSAKLATTSTGIDVTGTVVTDGITSDGVATVKVNSDGATAEVFNVYNTGSGNNTQARVYFGASAYSTAGRGLRIDAGRDSGADGIATFYSVDQAEHSDYEAIKILTDGGVTLSHLGNNKLATTSSGIDVTGTVVADSASVTGDAYVQTADGASAFYVTRYGTITSESAKFYIDDNDLIIDSTQDEQFGGFTFKSTLSGTGTRNRLDIASNGNISFYEDTGTTAKFFWDAAAESLGIGTSSPSTFTGFTNLTIKGGSNGANLDFFNNSGARKGAIVLDSVNSLITESTEQLVFKTGSSLTEAMRIDSSGNVGIGVTPENSSGTWRNVEQGGLNLVGRSAGGVDGMVGTNYVFKTDNSEVYKYTAGASRLFFDANEIKFQQVASGTAGTAISWSEAMRIDSSGNVGIAESDPQGLLHVDGFDYSYFSSNVGSATLDNQQGLAIGWNKSAGAGETVLIANQGAGSAGGMAFATNTSAGSYDERMRIDASGNLLVGKTSAGSNNVGAELRPQGYIFGTGDGINPLRLNRQTSDGMIADFQKDGISVGSIGCDSNSNFMLGQGDTGLSFQPGSDRIIPRNTDGSGRDGFIDLGGTGNRFKDLYLSSGINLNTASTADTITMTRGTNGQNNMLKFSTGSTDDWIVGQRNDGTSDFRFYSYGTSSDAVSITRTGNLLVGTTSIAITDEGFKVFSNGVVYGVVDNAQTNALWNKEGYTSGTTYFMDFRLDSVVKGSISSDGTSTSYNTSSDQRLKDNIVDAPSASDDIDAIQVRSFDWKADGSHQKYGMVAQELNTVAPEAVSAPEDPEEMMGVDYSKLVPMLVKEIQSLRARVAQLETN